MNECEPFAGFVDWFGEFETDKDLYVAAITGIGIVQQWQHSSWRMPMPMHAGVRTFECKPSYMRECGHQCTPSLAHMSTHTSIHTLSVAYFIVASHHEPVPSLAQICIPVLAPIRAYTCIRNHCCTPPCAHTPHTYAKPCKHASPWTTPISHVGTHIVYDTCVLHMVIAQCECKCPPLLFVFSNNWCPTTWSCVRWSGNSGQWGNV